MNILSEQSGDAPVEWGTAAIPGTLVATSFGIVVAGLQWLVDDLIERLPSCASVKRWVKAGDRLNMTTDLQTALGMVGLFDAQFDRLIADWKSIRHIEHRFFSEPETFTS